MSKKIVIDYTTREDPNPPDSTSESMMSVAVLDVVLDIWRIVAVSSLNSRIDGGRIMELRLHLAPPRTPPFNDLTDFSYGTLRWDAVNALRACGVIEDCELRRGRNPAFDQMRISAVPLRIRACLDELNSKLLLRS
jgi:hypothetical protein